MIKMKVLYGSLFTSESDWTVAYNFFISEGLFVCGFFFLHFVLLALEAKTCWTTPASCVLG